MHKIHLMIAVALLALSGAAMATNPPNPCGNHGNNCNPSGGDGGNASSNATGIGVGVGVGIGTGGNANSSNINQNSAQGGAGGQGGRGGDGGAGGTGIGLGGAGGSAAQAQGQDQVQGQKQGQGQSQQNLGVNTQGQSNTSSTATNQSQSSSANNAGNAQSTNVTLNEAEQADDITVRQAPTVITSAPYATASCYKTAAGGISGILGGLSIAGGKIDANCEHRELARVAAAIDPAAGKRVLCLSEAFQLANRSACAGIPLLYTLTRKERARIVQPDGK